MPPGGIAWTSFDGTTFKRPDAATSCLLSGIEFRGVAVAPRRRGRGRSSRHPRPSLDSWTAAGPRHRPAMRDLLAGCRCLELHGIPCDARRAVSDRGRPSPLSAAPRRASPVPPSALRASEFRDAITSVDAFAPGGAEILTVPGSFRSRSCASPEPLRRRRAGSHGRRSRDGPCWPRRVRAGRDR